MNERGTVGEGAPQPHHAVGIHHRGRKTVARGRIGGLGRARNDECVPARLGRRVREQDLSARIGLLDSHRCVVNDVAVLLLRPVKRGFHR